MTIDIKATLASCDYISKEIAAGRIDRGVAAANDDRRALALRVVELEAAQYQHFKTHACRTIK